MNIDEKIELFFFDFNRKPDEYRDYYKNVNEERFIRENKRTRFSPLYLLQRDASHCFLYGHRFNNNRRDLDDAIFAGIILIRIALTNTIKRVYFGNFEMFAKEYLAIDNKEYINALNELRNCLEHSYYSLSTIRKSDGAKIYFSLGPYNEIIRGCTEWNKRSKSEMYLVNPRRLFTSYINGMKLLKQDLLNKSNKQLRENFEMKLSLDEWILI